MDPSACTVHVRVVVENLQQVAHLEESLLVAEHLALGLAERLQNQCDCLLCVAAIRERLGVLIAVFNEVTAVLS